MTTLSASSMSYARSCVVVTVDILLAPGSPSQTVARELGLGTAQPCSLHEPTVEMRDGTVWTEVSSWNTCTGGPAVLGLDSSGSVRVVRFHTPALRGPDHTAVQPMPHLGVYPATRRLSDRRGSVTSGAGIEEVIPGSAAEAAGLRAGDEIQQLGNTRVGSTTELLMALRLAEHGRTKLTVLRGSRMQELEIDLMSAERWKALNRGQANRGTDSGRPEGSTSGTGSTGSRPSPARQGQARPTGTARIGAVQAENKLTADGLELHYSVELVVEGRKGLPTGAALLLEDTSGRAISLIGSPAGRTRTLDPPHEGTRWASLQLTLPYSRLSLRPGRHRVNPVIVIADEANRELTRWKGSTLDLEVPGATARISNVRLLPCTRELGVGLALKADVVVEGLSGQSIHMAAMLQRADGSPVRGIPGPYASAEGHAGRSWSGVGTDQITRFRNFEFFLPYHSLDLQPGQHQFATVIDVWSENWALARTEMVTFPTIVVPPTQQWAELRDVTLNLDQTVLFTKGLEVAATVDLGGYLGRSVYVTAFIEDRNSTALQDRDGLFAAKDGSVAAWQLLTPAHDPARFDQLRLFLGYDQLHLAPGRHELQAMVIVSDATTGQDLAYSQRIPFWYQQP